MRDKTGEVWEATHLGAGGTILLVLHSVIERRMHRCYVLDGGDWQWQVGDRRNIGDWNDDQTCLSNPWKRIA